MMASQILSAMHFVCHKGRNVSEEEFGFSSGFWPIKIKHVRPGVLFALHQSVAQESYLQGFLTGEIESRAEDKRIKVVVRAVLDPKPWPNKPHSNFSCYVYAPGYAEPDLPDSSFYTHGSTPQDSTYPDRRLKVGYAYVRDRSVRQRVRLRSDGHCEYCGASGFETLDGRRYIECHHIIALSDDGVDRDDNVIALCPDHHRQAHYGKFGAELEKELADIVTKIAKVSS